MQECNIHFLETATKKEIEILIDKLKLQNDRDFEEVISFFTSFVV